MPLQQTSGNVTADAYGGGAAAIPNYIEDVFSTYLFNTSASNQNIINGIDLATYGGLTWIKSRSNVFDHVLQTSAGSVNNALFSNSTSAALSGYYRIADLSNGFTFGTDYYTGTVQTTASWTFRKQPKFFDVVTWTGNNADGRLISHNLGSTPGMVIIKNLTSTYNWVVWHKDLANPSKYLVLNSTAATATDIYGPFGSYSAGFTTNASCFTSTGFYVAADARSNLASNDYVAYVFAHNAGGFGLTGTDNVISCGSFTTSSYYATVNLGYEPQFVLTKRTDSSTDGGWFMADTMRGLTANANATFATLFSNTSAAETQNGNIQLTSTGFVFGGAAASPYIYIAIRRGPMKVPTDATKVFAPVAYTPTSNNYPITTNFPVDLVFTDSRNIAIGASMVDRLRGDTTSSYIALNTYSTSAETNTSSYGWGLDSNTKVINNWDYHTQSPDVYNYVGWFTRRAPGFFDEVCYTAGASPQTVSHNLGVAPELILLKSRSDSGSWATYCAYFPTPANNYKPLNTNYASTYSGSWGTMTSSTFIVNGVNYPPATTAVAYLFATCAGVSKVGSYTGNGTTQTIDCGFGAGGARFVLITKSTVLSTGAWFVWDTARGMVNGSDPSLTLDNPANEVNTNSVYTVSTGFQLLASSSANVNISGETYIFLAIA
jgi:hypothetical protein